MLFARFPDRPLKMPLSMGNVGRWINKDGAQLRVIVRLSMEKEKTRLASNRETDLVRQLESAATLKLLLSQEDLNVPQKFSSILGRKSAEEGKIAGESQSPRRWDDLCTQSPASPLLQKTED